MYDPLPLSQLIYIRISFDNDCLILNNPGMEVGKDYQLHLTGKEAEAEMNWPWAQG